MIEKNKSQAREFQAANGEIVKLTEDEFQNLVEYFRTLSNWDTEMLLEAVNNSKIKLKPLKREGIKNFIGKDIYVSLFVKEEIQTKQWDCYYKLQKTRLEGYNRKANTCTVRNLNKNLIEIEVRNIFVSEDPQ